MLAILASWLMLTIVATYRILSVSQRAMTDAPCSHLKIENNKIILRCTQNVRLRGLNIVTHKYYWNRTNISINADDISLIIEFYQKIITEVQ